MEKNNYFSIIMPNYNKERYIKNTIKSVLNQTYKKFELIIVDDGSTDNSIELIKSFKDERIKVICQKNQGVSIARNCGIQEAKYSLIAFLDSDDYWYPYFLTEMNQMVNEFPDAGAYGCTIIRKKLECGTSVENYENSVESSVYYIDNYFHNLLYGESVLTASSTVVRKSTLSTCGLFPEGIKNWEDFDLWIRIGLYSRICFTDRICALYNEVEGSASQDRSNMRAPVFENYQYHIKKSGISGEQKRDFIKLVVQKKQHAAYEKFLVDGKRIPALKEYLYTLPYSFGDYLYWSAICQFIITPDKFFKILRLVKNKNNK